MTPKWILVGEGQREKRDPAEAIRTGHISLISFHAESLRGSIQASYRASKQSGTDLSEKGFSDNGGELCLWCISKSCSTIRKVLNITEVVGTDGEKYTQDVFRYEMRVSKDGRSWVNTGGRGHFGKSYKSCLEKCFRKK